MSYQNVDIKTSKENRTTTATTFIEVNSKQRHHVVNAKSKQSHVSTNDSIQLRHRNRKRHKSAGGTSGLGEYPSSLPILVDHSDVTQQQKQLISADSAMMSPADLPPSLVNVNSSVNSADMAKVFTTARPTIIIYPTGIVNTVLLVRDCNLTG